MARSDEDIRADALFTLSALEREFPENRISGLARNHLEVLLSQPGVDAKKLDKTAKDFKQELRKLPRYETRVFLCHRDYRQCRRSDKRWLCVAILVICLAAQLVPKSVGAEGDSSD
jgi:hypothetical protein